jgi:ribonucleotide reductase beta subunit family protein with ferritin-like domain
MVPQNYLSMSYEHMLAAGENNDSLDTRYNELQERIINLEYVKHEMDLEEPLLNEEQRFCLFPIVHRDIWDMHKKQEAAFWTAGEIDFSKDYNDWERLSDEYKWFVKHVLAFFAGSDGIVNLNIMRNFSKDVPIFEAQVFYQYQGMMENIHSEVYSLMIETYIRDLKEKDTLFNAIKHIPCVFKKMEWALKWLSSNDRFAKRLVAFAVVEGIFFSGSFCAIYWLKEQNLLPGLTMSNEFISRDEGMHTEFACLLYSKLKNRLTEEEVHETIRDAVAIEKEFITESLPCRLIGMNSELMCQYIEYVADRLCVMLGYNKIYEARNPFQFMEMISVDGKENFFESRGSSYQKAAVINQGISAVTFTDDF